MLSDYPSVFSRINITDHWETRLGSRSWCMTRKNHHWSMSSALQFSRGRIHFAGSGRKWYVNTLFVRCRAFKLCCNTNTYILKLRSKYYETRGLLLTCSSFNKQYRIKTDHTCSQKSCFSSIVITCMDLFFRFRCTIFRVRSKQHVKTNT